MTGTTPTNLKPRKRPVQNRSRVTVDAIFEATIQVLLRDGVNRLTTTAVAERAGVSVGTMYQYFPNKQALVYALNERYLIALAERIEATCQQQNGAPLNQMVQALIETYWIAKTEREDVTRALYRSVVELDNDALIHAFSTRVNKATIRMLESASDVLLADVEATNLTLVTVIFGTVRNAFERGLTQDQASQLRHNLQAMCIAYLAPLSKGKTDDLCEIKSAISNHSPERIGTC